VAVSPSVYSLSICLASAPSTPITYRMMNTEIADEKATEEEEKSDTVCAWIVLLARHFFLVPTALFPT
jgi:hypothetical protein